MPSSRILRVVSGPDSGRIHHVTHFPLTVGRNAECDVCLTADDIAARHAVLEEADGCLLIRDLDSESGTFLNGNPVQTEILNPGDTLSFGTTIVQFWVHGAGAGTAPSPGGLPAEQPDHVARVPSPYLPAGDAREIQVALSGAEVSAIFQRPAGLAVDGERLAEAQQSLAAVYEINKVLGTTFDLETVLCRVLDIVLATADGDRGVVLLTEGSTDGATVRVARRHPGKARVGEGDTLKISRTIVQHVLTTGEAVLTTDAASDDRFREGDSVLSLNIHSAMCVPLMGRREMMGVVHLDAGDRNVFTEESLRLLACIADIAGKVIENARLYQANLDAERLAAVGETVAGTAHYMKNLLTGLMAGAELVDLGLESNDSDAIAAGWAPIRKNLDILSDMVLNMLDYSRDRTPGFQAVHATELFSDLVELVRLRAEGRSVDLRIEQVGAVPPLRADPIALHRALLNLLTNSIDAIPEDRPGTVVLRARGTDDHLVLELTDDGTGIPDSVLPHIFDIFCTTKGARGTGFGLPVTKKIVEEHGGRLEVDTEVGAGSTFRVLIPR